LSDRLPHEHVNTEVTCDSRKAVEGDPAARPPTHPVGKCARRTDYFYVAETLEF
jgi:hypothetical protein